MTLRVTNILNFENISPEAMEHLKNPPSVFVTFLVERRSGMWFITILNSHAIEGA